VAIAGALAYNKMAFTWKQNEFRGYINGVEAFTPITVGDVLAPNILNQINFANAVNSNQWFNAETKQLQLFNTALTDAEALTLTTL
jgi:hypothetical protein